MAPTLRILLPPQIFFNESLKCSKPWVDCLWCIIRVNKLQLSLSGILSHSFKQDLRYHTQLDFLKNWYLLGHSKVEEAGHFFTVSPEALISIRLADHEDVSGPSGLCGML